MTLRNTDNQSAGKNLDEFVHDIQKQKMKELWDNEEDKAWESA